LQEADISWMGFPSGDAPPPDRDEGRLALEAACIGTWCWAEAAAVMRLSPIARQLLGASAEAGDLTAFLECFHPGDRPALTAALDAAVTRNSAFELECRLRSKQEAETWLRIKGGRGQTQLPGQAVEIRGILMAAGPRPQGDGEKHRLAAIVTSSDDAIIGKTVDGIITDWNPSAEVIFGYAADEVMGKPITILAAPDREADMPTILARIRNGERVKHYETRRRRKDGTVIDVSITVSPVFDTRGEIVGVSKVARDITQVKRAQTAQQKTQKEMQELQVNLMQMSRLTALGEMASTLAHELNQPLTAIANYLQGSRMLLASGREDALPSVREAVNQAVEQALRAGKVIRSLRDFLARGETEHKDESLPRIIEEASALALLGMREDGVAVAFDLAPEADRVSCNKVQIQQVLLNLIRNAMEAMHQAPVRRLLLASRRIEPDLVELSVHDTGHGISPAIREKLFQPFVTTKPRGMGVGLSISRTIVEAHGGRLWVESGPDGGSVFRLTLRQRATEEPFDDS
jgi:two-component system sensor kinase FixL